MKYLRLFALGTSGLVLGAALLLAAYLLLTLPAWSEQRKESRQQERQEFVDQSISECRNQFPLDLISRYQCYEELLG